MLNSELLPFFALSPELVIKRRDELLTKEGTYHMNVTSGRIHLLTPNTPRSRSVHALTPGFEHLLPDMEIHTHVHDMGPYILDQELVRRVEKAVSEGTCEYIFRSGGSIASDRLLVQISTRRNLRSWRAEKGTIGLAH